MDSINSNVDKKNDQKKHLEKIFDDYRKFLIYR